MDVHALTLEVRALARLNLEELRTEWRRRYGPPPRLRSPELLAHLLAWRIQADAFGGLDAETRTALMQRSTPLAAPTISPGTRLEREWRGVTEVVEVTDSGFLWRDRAFPSLTKVAQAITGVKWNGPRFFGLRPAEGR